MTMTKSESPAPEKKGEKMKRYSEEKEEVKASKIKKEKQQQHPVSESSPRSVPFNASKPPSAPTLQDSFNSHSSHRCVSEGDLQMVVATSHSHSSVSDGAIKVVKEEPNNKSTTVAVTTDVEEVEEEGTRDDGVSRREGTWYIVLLALRIAAFVFCKIAFSVLAADQEKKVRRVSYTNTWYGVYAYYQTHWYDFREFKYCLSVNVIGFVYSGIQICDLVKYLITKRHTLDPKLRGYINFAMDQALAYLLMSASSSAATAASRWTNSASAADKYVEMAKASVALSFVAFVAFASSSIVSAFIFCRFN
ncbi:CASP protein N24 [Spatholobus suberectus]|nr:CASP protein N24 [Spatholobus suberectus]